MEETMRVVIIGSTGLIGKAVCALLRAKGHEVVEASRTTQPGVDLDDPASIRAFCKALGETDAIICVAGRRSDGNGPLADLSDEAIESAIRGKMLGQVNIVRHALANLRPGGVFILTGGMSAYAPVPKMSASAMVNTGLEGFVRHAALELQDGRRIVVVHPPPVREAVIQLGLDGSRSPAAATVAATYVAALESNITGQPMFVEGHRPG
jgi:NAD(P)-dependent dehydrogenase (short-subunit alcohol dehydrogenase family)